MCDLDINPHCTTCLCDAQRNSPLGSESLFKPGPAVITHIQWRVLAWCDWAIHRESGAKVSGPWLSAVKESNAPPTLRKCSNCADKGREMVHLILSISRSCCIMLFVFAGSEECSDCLQGDRVTSSFRSLFDQQHEQRTWTPPPGVHVSLRDIQCQHTSAAHCPAVTGFCLHSPRLFICVSCVEQVWDS